MRARILAIMAVALGGCATVLEGTTQVVSVDSDPRGASCDLFRETLNIGAATTPGAVMVTKSRLDITLICKKAGYEDANGSIKSGTSVALAGNAAVGGLVGLAVDAASGAANKYDNMTFVTLTPKPGQPPAPALSSTQPGPAMQPVVFDAPIGQEFRNALTVGPVQVPLLDGGWVVAGKGVSAKPSGDDTAVSLVRIEHGKLWGVIRVWAGVRPAGTGVGAFRPCERNDVLHTLVANNVDHGEQDCWIVNHYMMGEARARATELHLIQSYSYLDGRGVVVPGTMIAAIHRIATPTGYVTAWYLVNPELFGFQPPATAEWRDSAWHRDRIATDPKRAAFVESLTTINGEYQGYLRAGFQQQLGAFTGKSLAGWTEADAR